MPQRHISFQIITEEIIGKGACARCGACVGLCPYLQLYEGGIVFPDACDLEGGRCLNFCPKGPVDFAELARKVFGEEDNEFSLGHVMKIVMARASEASGTQYGGVATTLAQAAMREYGLPGALLTAWRNRPFPEGVIVEDPGDVSRYSGAHYAGAYTLAALNRARKGNPSPLAIVGLPCQILALRRMQAFDHPENFHYGKDDFLIGLFCTWSLNPRPFREEMRRRFGGRTVARYDIPPPPANRFDIFFEDGKRVAIPLEEIRPLINPGCRTCGDMTAEFADISVGATEGFEGWNTVLIRTERGADLLNRLVKEGSMELRALPEVSLAHLREAAALRKERVSGLPDHGDGPSKIAHPPGES